VNFITLTDPAGASAVVAPELGAWLLRYARTLPKHGPVDALHFSEAALERFPRDMCAGNPVLFPLVSFNHLPGLDHHYQWQGRVLPMPLHGFAMRSKWTVVERAAASVTMELTEDETTRAQYPFAFCHQLTYRLREGRLHWVQTVQNRSPAPMPFSTGFHPYLAVPLTPRGDRSACFVRIPPGTLLTMHGRGERFTAEPFAARDWPVRLDVSATMFLGDLAKRELALVDPLSQLQVVFNFQAAPQHRFVALWAESAGEPYYCLEPWTALSNSFTHAREHGLLLLPPGATFQAAFWMELRPVSGSGHELPA
jgi:galactose mutarotase-like enzyme